MLPLRFRPYGELRASGHIARRVDQMSPMIPATHTTRPVTGFVQPDRLSLMRFDADRSACRYFSHSLHVARAKARQYRSAPPECFDDSLIENLAKIGVVETNFARRFVIFEGHDLIGLLAPRQDPRSEPPEQPTSVVHSRSGFVGHDLHGRSLGCNTPATFPFPGESSHFDLKSSGPLDPWSRRGRAQRPTRTLDAS